MRVSDKHGCLVLAAAVILIVIVGVVLMRLNRQPRVTPAASSESMQEQLSPQTNPKH